MARQTTKRKIETPETAFTFNDLPEAIQDEVKDRVSKMSVHEVIKHEHGIDALRAELKRYEMAITQNKEEIDRLNGVIRQKDIVIYHLQKGNEQISDELSKARHGNL